MEQKHHHLGSEIDPRLDIKHSALQVGKELGRGGFGIVYEGFWELNLKRRERVAIKQLNQQLSAEIIADFKQEVLVHVNLDHPNIVEMIGITFTQPYSIVMEYMSGGSLYGLLQGTLYSELEWSIRIAIGRDITAGLSYLHGLKPSIIHRDLKSMNVLLDLEGNAKIADFGMSRVKTATQILTGVGGSLPWMSPKLFDPKNGPNEASDLHALGMVLWEMSTHTTPYSDKSTLPAVIGAIMQGPPQISAGMPDGYRVVMESCWSFNNNSPPPAEFILAQLTKLMDPQLKRSKKDNCAPQKIPDYRQPLHVDPAAITTTTKKLLTAPLKPAPRPPSYKMQLSGVVTQSTLNSQQLSLARKPLNPVDHYQHFQSARSIDMQNNQAIMQDRDWLNKNMSMPGAKEFFIGDSYYQKNQLLESFQHYQTAAKSGYPPAYFMLHRVCETLINSSQIKQKNDWLKKVAESEIFLNKIIECISWLQTQSHTGNPVAQYVLGTILLHAQDPNNGSNLGYQYLLMAAVQGYAHAEIFIAQLFITGQDPEDLRFAFNLAYNASNRENVFALHLIGELYEKGIGTHPDARNALNCYLRAAQLGYRNAFYRLGLVYQNGQLGEQVNPRLAKEYYEKAAVLDCSLAYLKLGLAHDEGSLGLKQNFHYAAENYCKAAQLGDALGQRMYAFCLENGKGVSSNIHLALYWYHLAAIQNDVDANYEVVRLRNEIRASYHGELPQSIPDEYRAYVVVALGWVYFNNYYLSDVTKSFGSLILLMRSCIVNGITIKFKGEVNKLFEGLLSKQSSAIRSQVDYLSELIRCIRTIRKQKCDTDSDNEADVDPTYQPKNPVTFAELLLQANTSRNADCLIKELIDIYVSSGGGRKKILKFLLQPESNIIKLKIGQQQLTLQEYLASYFDLKTLQPKPSAPPLTTSMSHPKPSAPELTVTGTNHANILGQLQAAPCPPPRRSTPAAEPRQSKFMSKDPKALAAQVESADVKYFQITLIPKKNPAHVLTTMREMIGKGIIVTMDKSKESELEKSLPSKQKSELKRLQIIFERMDTVRKHRHEELSFFTEVFQYMSTYHDDSGSVTPAELHKEFLTILMSQVGGREKIQQIITDLERLNKTTCYIRTKSYNIHEYINMMLDTNSKFTQMLQGPAKMF